MPLNTDPIFGLNPDGDEEPPVDCHGIDAEIGAGKTRTWCHEIARQSHSGAIGSAVLAVPRHRLGDEIVQVFADFDVVAHVYRGREADDPDALGEHMCRELERVQMVLAAFGRAGEHACRHKDQVCAHYDVCGYQRQARQTPQVWIVPHQLLFRARPKFILKPDALGIDEAFWSAALHGVDKPVTMSLKALLEIDVQIARHPEDTADLHDLRYRVYQALKDESDGWLERARLLEAGILAGDAKLARRLELRRKKRLDDIRPGMPLTRVRKIYKAIGKHNKEVMRLARFWKLIFNTINSPHDRSPWLRVEYDGDFDPEISMIWRDDIHRDWRARTVLLDATMPVEINRQFFPGLGEVRKLKAAMPHTFVRQVSDDLFAKSKLVPSPGASTKTNTTRQNNAEKVRRYIEVRAAAFWPGRVAVICQKGLEEVLKARPLPENVEIDHYNNVSGLNRFSDVALIVAIGRTEPPARNVERTARALFGADIPEIPADAKGAVRYEQTPRGITMRDGTGRQVMAHHHPDPRAEETRYAIAEAGVIQAIGRGRGANRSAANPLAIDILCSIPLPLPVDELTPWSAMQPRLVDVMRARGAVPVQYADMALAYADLFASAGAAQQALRRENPLQTPIERFLIGVCRGFLSIRYRRGSSRGPGGRLLYDPARVDPLAWLTERLTDVELRDKPVPVQPEATDADDCATEWASLRRAIWSAPLSYDIPAHCGRTGRPSD